MNSRRAREIVSSRDMVHVTYNDTPIYIELVDTDKDTASIHALAEPGRSQEVSLSNLKEH